MHRKLLGAGADVDLDTQLLANIEYHLRGANWQRGAGKGSRPKPLELPGGKKAKKRETGGADVARRLRNLGHIPA